MRNVVLWPDGKAVSHDAFQLHVEYVRVVFITIIIRYRIYVDDVIVNLQDKRLGCSVCGSYIGCLMYADDLGSSRSRAARFRAAQYRAERFSAVSENFILW